MQCHVIALVTTGATYARQQPIYIEREKKRKTQKERRKEERKKANTPKSHNTATAAGVQTWFLACVVLVSFGHRLTSSAKSAATAAGPTGPWLSRSRLCSCLVMAEGTHAWCLKGHDGGARACDEKQKRCLGGKKKHPSFQSCLWSIKHLTAGQCVLFSVHFRKHTQNMSYHT